MSWAERDADRQEGERHELEQGRLDTARLDWLEDNCTYRGGGNGGVFTFATPKDTECFRDAIDAAMNSPHPKG